MKTIKTAEYTWKADLIEELFREQKTLKQLDHQNIIKFYHAFKVDNEICLLMEYADEGELEQYLINCLDYRMKEVEARYFISQICRAILFWHQKGIIHRDLKPENILLCSKYKSGSVNTLTNFNSAEGKDKSYENLVVKIGDFGIAGIKRAGAKGEETNSGTFKFMAPELHIGDEKEANSALDIWMIGNMLYIMVYGYHPFKVKDRAQTIKNIINQPVIFSEEIKVSEEWKDLIKKMLEKNPKNRISMFKIMSHKWFEMSDSDILHSIEEAAQLK